MHTQHHIGTAVFQDIIPILDIDFDAKSPEIDDFIFSHAQDHNEDRYFMEFNKRAR